MTNKDLISQYVDTGIGIPRYQYDRLPIWAKKTYLRKRLIRGIIKSYEFDDLSHEQQMQYLSIVMDNPTQYLHLLTVNQYEMLPDGKIKDEIKKYIIDGIEGSWLAGQRLSQHDEDFMEYFKI
jgi:hypothetical protein